MLKLMKYEMRKQLLSKIIILITIGVLQCVFIYGVIVDKESTIGFSVGIFSILAFIAVIFVSFEAILTFSNDLKTKQSYMLFLTPNSAYKIVGAKIISSVVQIFLTGAAFVAIIAGNILFLTIRYDKVDEIIEVIREMFQHFLGIDIKLEYVIAVLIYAVLNWLSVVIIGMLSITLSSTFLANTKLKGFVSGAIFFGLNILLSKIYNVILPEITFTVQDFLYADIAILIVIAISYLATSWMLDKKVSV